MNKVVLATVIATASLAGCSSVPMESRAVEMQAKEFNPPSEDTAGIYVFRKDTFVGAALKKDVWIEKECVGQTAKGVFFYKEVPGNERLEISTESEFSPNTLTIEAQNGKLYFVEQFIKMGAFVGGADLQLAHAETGKSEVLRLGMAKGGDCDSTIQ
ncbi:DUF2846 domain-containing protein [Neptuniibacter sp. QD48_55]|uniref:DUF2846 domain-containing protein n=1 Tax=Neptuniibacter sp. QD48_55 TaxID=3398212 RepID=UPI0039F46041